MAINPDPTLLRAKPDKATLDGFIEMLRAAWTYNSTTSMMEFTGYHQGWLLNKDGTDQADLGTSLELVTWVDSHADAETNNVTFSDDDDSITILTAGRYFVCATLSFNFNGANDRVQTQIQVGGSGVIQCIVSIAAISSFISVTATSILNLAVNDVLTVFGRNVNITTADVSGTAANSYFIGARVG